MRPVEVLLVVGAGAVGVLRSPAARARTGRVASSIYWAAAPVAGSAARAASRQYANLRGRIGKRAAPGPIHCTRSGCSWTQPFPSSAEFLAHMRDSHGPTGVAKAPSASPPSPAAPGTPPVDEPSPFRPASVTTIADGVYIIRELERTIEEIGLHMDQFRAATRAINAAGDIEPQGLLALLGALAGTQTVLAAAANLITNLTEHADVEMWVDLKALRPLYESAGVVLGEVTTIRKAMKQIRDLYPEEIALEEKRLDDDGGVRMLNPKVLHHSRA